MKSQTKEIGAWPPTPPDQIKDGCFYRGYAHGETILLEGEVGNRVCFLLKGRCKIYTSGSQGQMLIQNIVQAPEVFGMIEQFRKLSNVCTVEAFGQVETWEVPNMLYLEWLKNDHQFALAMLARVSDIAYMQIERQSSNILSPLKQRLIGFLIAHFEGERVIHIEKRELAGRLATSVRHLNRVIKTCQMGGVLDYSDGRIYVDNWELLTVFKDRE